MVPLTKLKMVGDVALSVGAVRIWNDLSYAFVNVPSSLVFNKHLKLISGQSADSKTNCIHSFIFVY